MPEPGVELAGFVLNAPRSSVIAVSDPVSAWGLYKSDDDQTHSDDLRVSAAMAAGAAGTSFALAQQAIRPPGTIYSPLRSLIRRRRPGRLSPRGAGGPTRGVRRRCRRPGPVLSPDDPRYGRPMRPPVYSDRGACRPVRCFRRMIRVTAARWHRRRSIPTAARRPVRFCRRMIPVMAVPADRRR